MANGPSDAELADALEPLRRLLRPEQLGSAFYMWQLEDATMDPRRFAQMDTVFEDFTRLTKADVQELAREYLRPDKAIRVSILPGG